MKTENAIIFMRYEQYQQRKCRKQLFLYFTFTYKDIAAQNRTQEGAFRKIPGNIMNHNQLTYQHLTGLPKGSCRA